MGVLIDVISEIYCRLNNAIETGDLPKVKDIRIGHVREIHKENDLPYVGIVMGSGVSNNIRLTGKISASPSITILIRDSRIKYPNQYFDEGLERGAVFLLERIIDKLFLDKTGARDLGFNGTVRDTPDVSWVIDESDDFVNIDLTLSINARDAEYGNFSATSFEDEELEVIMELGGSIASLDFIAQLDKIINVDLQSPAFDPA